MGILSDFEGEKAYQMCSFMCADNFWIMSHSEMNLVQMLQDLIEEAEVGPGTQACESVVDEYLRA